jgi:hypothetical protein
LRETRSFPSTVPGPVDLSRGLLPDQITHCMPDLAALPTIVDAPDQPLAKHQPLIARLRRNPAAVRTAVLLVELGHQRSSS